LNALAAFASGLVFGIGLVVSGMSNPAKVIGFLDVAGRFDPTLPVVMASGLAVAAIGYAIAKRRTASYAGGAFDIPTSRTLDRRLIAGAIVFGIGWGIAGVCPGPGFVILGAGRVEGVVFVVAMLAGMGAFELLERRRGQAPPEPVQS
jgi:uncharacterized membrane protein YedE/YeeE